MKQTISTICTTILVLMWSYAAFSKLSNPLRMQDQLQQLGIPLFRSTAQLISWIVPILELLIAVAIIAVRSRKLGLLGSLVLLSVFQLYIVYLLVYSPHLPCSCGGIIDKLTWTQHLIFNFIAMLMALYAYQNTSRFEAKTRATIFLSSDSPG